jgi:hypothetical protein
MEKYEGKMVRVQIGAVRANDHLSSRKCRAECGVLL